MKRGLSYLPGLSSASHPPQAVCGIPVEYRPDSKHPFADARGFGRYARIVVGPAWCRLDGGLQQAVLYHEAGHIKGRHRELRVIGLLLLMQPAVWLLPWSVLTCILATLAVYFCVERLAQNQEIQADRFAAKKGLGAQMLAFVRQAGPPPMVPFFYPDYERRVGALTSYLEEQKK